VSVVESRSMAEPARSLRASLLGLSWLNFFLSGMQTAFGPIAAAYLALQGWTAKDIGFALTNRQHREFRQSDPSGQHRLQRTVDKAYRHGSQYSADRRWGNCFVSRGMHSSGSHLKWAGLIRWSRCNRLDLRVRGMDAG
jgi:hypothetical protein